MGPPEAETAPSHAYLRPIDTELGWGVDQVGAPRELDGARSRLLSDRESQCLIQSARGKTTSEIGQALQISERTVAFHLSNVRRKLGAANSRHAVTKAFSLRLIAAGL